MLQVSTPSLTQSLKDAKSLTNLFLPTRKIPVRQPVVCAGSLTLCPRDFAANHCNLHANSTLWILLDR